MRNGVIGIVIGLVVGAIVIAPRLAPSVPVSGAVPSVLKPAAGPATRVSGAENLAAAPLAPKRSPRVRWKMGSAFAAALPQLGTLAKRVDEEIWRVSGGDMEIKFHDPGTLVPTLDMFDAVASGAIDAAFSSPGSWGTQSPALRLFSAVLFGPPADAYLAWVYFGCGRELFENLHRRHNIHALVCGIIAPEASGWFRNEIQTLEDFKGLRMGFLGLGAKVLTKLGVETRALTGGNVFLALEAGAVDATEYSMPAIDLKLGFHAMAKHYYFPGWHQPATLFSLMINMDRWEELNSARQARVDSVCGDNIRHGLAEGEALQFAALKALQLKGVQMHRWPDTILDVLESSWQDVVVEEATADEDFKQVWESMSEFRRDYGIWKELGHLNRWAADGLPARLVLAVPRMQSPSPWLNKIPPGRASAS